MRASVVTAAATTAVVFSAGAASAHIEVDTYGSDDPEKGGYAAITLRVPDDDDTNRTTKVSIAIDPEYKIGDVETTPIPWVDHSDDHEKVGPARDRRRR